MYINCVLPQVCSLTTLLVKKCKIGNVQVAHNFIAILSIILHFCPGNPNYNRASVPSNLFARLIKKITMDPCYSVL